MHANVEALKWLHRPQAHFTRLCHWGQVSCQGLLSKTETDPRGDILKTAERFFSEPGRECCLKPASAGQGRGLKLLLQKTVSNHRYLSWTLFSNTLISFLEAKSNPPSVALISAAFLECWLGNISKDGGRCCPCSGEIWIFSQSYALQPCNAFPAFYVCIKSFCSCMKSNVKKDGSFLFSMNPQNFGCFAGSGSMSICSHHNLPILVHLIFCFNLFCGFDCTWGFF